MKLTAEQESTVRAWAEAGASLNDLQNQLRDEMGLRLTFMEVRFLVLDLGLVLKSDLVEEAPAPKPEVPVEMPDDALDGVQFSADEITQPGAIASGKVTFSDGVLASWFLDQQGRLGLQAGDPTYQPPKEDVPLFQQKLQAHLQRMGMY